MNEYVNWKSHDGEYLEQLLNHSDCVMWVAEEDPPRSRQSRRASL